MTRSATHDGAHHRPAPGAVADHRLATLGARDRRAAWRSTVSSEPGPRQAMTGTPAIAHRCASRSRSSSRSRHTSRASRASSTPVAAAERVVGGLRPLQLDGQGVDHHDRVAAAGQPHRVRERLGRHQGGQEHHERARRDAAAQLGAQRAFVAHRAPARLGPAQAEQHPGELVVAADGGHLDHAAATQHRQPDPVAGAEVVRGDGAGRLDRDVEAGPPPGLRVALAEVADRVEHQAHLGILVGVGRRDVQGTGAQRDRPVDAAQPVAGAERADLGQLGAAPDARAAVLADQPHRVRQGGPGGEGARGRHGGDASRPAARTRSRRSTRRCRSRRPAPGRAGARPSGRSGPGPPSARWPHRSGPR